MKRFISVNTNTMIWLVIFLATLIVIPTTVITLMPGDEVRSVNVAIVVGTGYATLLNLVYKNIFSHEFIRFSLSLGTTRQELFNNSMRKVMLSILGISASMLIFTSNVPTGFDVGFTFSFPLTIFLVMFAHIYDDLKKKPIIYMIIPGLFALSNLSEIVMIIIMLAGSVLFYFVIRSIYLTGELS
ncbi:hypothetical protein ERUR111494_08010 [Erysipelothrix urinaevulpis]|uniref:hypothetical protein n=1 Tax=Erysipelothrix urinaevulpis TaxID=2683717 RepID=UPI0013584242|nr:hypothetical protein [Erysipelothrix urinaevulpis]